MSTAERVKKLISEHLGFDRRPVDDGDQMCADLGADSLDAIEIIMQLEVEFGIKIPDADVEDFADMTVKQIIDVVEKRLPAQAA